MADPCAQEPTLIEVAVLITSILGNWQKFEENAIAILEARGTHREVNQFKRALAHFKSRMESGEYGQINPIHPDTSIMAYGKIHETFYNYETNTRYSADFDPVTGEYQKGSGHFASADGEILYRTEEDSPQWIKGEYREDNQQDLEEKE